MNFLIQFPTYSRGQKFLGVLSNWVHRASHKHRLFFNINCDAADLTMTSEYVQKRIEFLFDTYGNNDMSYKIHYDDNTEKISAINNHIPNYGWDIVVCASDDMVPQVMDWDDEIAQAMEEHFPGMDGCVYFDDGSHSAKDLVTLSIMGSQLYNQFGYIYHPDYKSLYCDNEFTEVMRHHNKLKYINKKIITHEHWSIEGSENYGQQDMAVVKTLHYSGRDQRVYEERKRRGFPKEKITND
jgi:hypothetical protein